MNKHTQLVHQTYLVPGKLYRSTSARSVILLLSINGTTHRSNEGELYTNDCVFIYTEDAYVTPKPICMWHSCWLLIEEQ